MFGGEYAQGGWTGQVPGGSIQCLVASMPRVVGQDRLVRARSEAARFTRKALLVVCSFLRLQDEAEYSYRKPVLRKASCSTFY